MLNNANYAVFITNQSMFRSFSDLQSSGILFRSLKCYHCHRYLEMQMEEKYGNTAPTEEDELYDPDNAQIRIFQCQHTFHMGCIYKICSAELAEEGKPNDKMRCPRCYSQNFDIENDNGSPMRPRNRGPPQT